MRKNSKKYGALKTLKLDAPLVNVRRALRELHGLSDDEMAKRLKVSKQYIYLHMIGARSNAQIQAGIAAMFSVDREEIFE